MIDEIYVDGVLAAGFHRGMLRIEFFSVAPGAGSPGGPASEERKQPRQRLIMTPQGFAETYGVFTEIMLKLKQAGLLGEPGGRGVDAAQTGSSEASGAGGAGPGTGLGSVSPNF